MLERGNSSYQSNERKNEGGREREKDGVRGREKGRERVSCASVKTQWLVHTINFNIAYAELLVEQKTVKRNIWAPVNDERGFGEGGKEAKKIPLNFFLRFFKV